MTNKKNPVSSVQNIFFDSEQLDNLDLTVEQNYNNNFQTSLINNHIGNGVLPETLSQNILFDSLLVSGFLDGVAIGTQSQPSDNNLGNQLEIELTNSKVAGKKSVKIAIIGLDFQGNLQYDTFVFKLNEKQITKKHYTSILTILINDFIGISTQSFNLGGRILIKEAKPYSISRDPIMVSQDVEPNLFWRDFYTASGQSLQNFLVASLPLYNVDNLNIKTGFLQYTPIIKNDVVSQIGEKFLATTNNIEKISLLLGVQNTDTGQASNLVWHGDLIISIYALQSTIDCPTDIVPNLAIDFPPSNIPLAQLSINYASLQSQGITLDGNAQPVDFVFSNTLVANGNNIKSGQYYAFTIKRSGSADQCDILIATGTSHSSTSRVSIFSGSFWVDLPDQELWFKIYTDAAKISDGQAYETGHGIIIPKTATDSLTNAQIDYSLSTIPFVGNELFTATLFANSERSETVQDQRTGNPINSRQQFVPNVQLLNSIDLANLQIASNPLTIGIISDKNQKSNSSDVLSASLHAWNFVNNVFTIKVIDDTTDGYRYDSNVNSLISNLVNGDFTNAKIIPNVNQPNKFYRITKSELISMTYGDVNGDGVIDDTDLTLLNSLVGIDFNNSPPINSQITTNGITTTAVNGYSVYVNKFVNSNSISFQIVNSITNAVAASASDGLLVKDPNSNNLATFQSALVNFSTISAIGNYKLVITSSTSQANVGSFAIAGVNSTSNFIIDISKVFLNSDIMMQILRADIDGDFTITSNDGYLLQQYINKAPPFPTSTLPQSKIGTSFDVIRITVDPFTYKDVGNTLLERNDDFPFFASNRATSLHTTQDIFLNDGYFTSHNFKLNPASFNIVKQFSWEENLIVVNGNARVVPTIFNSSISSTQNNCSFDGIKYQIFPHSSDFEPGAIDTFIPNDLIIGNGNLKNIDGSFYKMDLEIGSITLEIPNNVLGTEQTINIFDYFVSNYNDTGKTRFGYPAMRFADCGFVETTAINDNQIRFYVAAQSFSPNIDGLDIDGYTGIIVDGKMGVYLDHSTGLLKLNFTNLYQDPVLQTLNTKIQINVYMKKAGFNNAPLFVSSETMTNLFQLIS